jgi:hypothetical protein
MSLLGYLLAGAVLVGIGFAIVSLMLTIVRAVDALAAGTVALVRLLEPLRHDERVP